jgi:protein-S-isoprenylcysteine O-methyltransferase Ste14
VGIVKEHFNDWTFPVAGITLVLCWLLFILYFHTPVSQVLFIFGNVTVITGVLLILLTMRILRKSGEPEDKEDFTYTTEIVKHEIYSVVRPPLYLGWFLACPVVMMVSQQRLIVSLGGFGMASNIQITRNADIQLIAKFSPEYENYMKEVPRLNIILGIARKLKRGI